MGAGSRNRWRDRWRDGWRANWQWIAGIVAGVLVVAYGVAYLIDKPLRTQLERRMNAALTGYRVQVGSASFHPLGFGLDLRDVVVVPEKTPDQPIAEIPKLSASVQWRALIHGRLVAGFEFERPRLHVDRRQAEQEAADGVPVQQRGWQRAVESIYPLKIDELQVHDGSVTYLPGGPFRPLRMTDVEFRAENIRNVHSTDRTYPSDVHLRATVLEKAQLRMDGRADFLAEPYPGIDVHTDLADLELDYLKPIVQRYNVAVRRGVLSLRGAVEYGPKVAVVHLEDLTLRGADIDYVHTQATAPVEAERAEAGARATKRATSEPDTMTLRADHASITDSTFGYDNRAADPPYRVFIATQALTLRGFSNQLREGTAEAELRGALMGNGPTAVDATFRPEVHGPDFDVAIRIEDTDMRSLNDVWRAYGGFDVAQGFFSFYSELHVKNGRVQGYMKPLFREVKVYSPEQERGKPVRQKIYEGVVGGIGWLLQNRSQEQVATKTDISGTLQNPNTSTWQVLVGLVQNAFFKAILPGLEREAGAG